MWEMAFPSLRVCLANKGPFYFATRRLERWSLLLYDFSAPASSAASTVSVAEMAFPRFETERKQSLVLGNGTEPLYPNRL